ncbi:hypothetical protein VNO77_00920 [Canavalia gladiata]|uniref:Uncharacterized protein n=1 Tax=Canavalia gladiata TaxID=3824 RepID=A0AAN9MQZ6_CANGL
MVGNSRHRFLPLLNKTFAAAFSTVIKDQLFVQHTHHTSQKVGMDRPRIKATTPKDESSEEFKERTQRMGRI